MIFETRSDTFFLAFLLTMHSGVFEYSYKMFETDYFYNALIYKVAEMIFCSLLNIGKNDNMINLFWWHFINVYKSLEIKCVIEDFWRFDKITYDWDLFMLKNGNEVGMYWIMDHAIIMAITKVGGSVVNFGLANIICTLKPLSGFENIILQFWYIYK